MIKVKQQPFKPWKERTSGGKIYIVAMCLLGLVSGRFTVFFWFVVIPRAMAVAVLMGIAKGQGKIKRGRF